MKPRIEIWQETKLIGIKSIMSFDNDKTGELWKAFSPRRKEIKESVNTRLYSVEIYPDPNFYKNYTPATAYEKWAAIEVSDFLTIPDGMNALIIPQGQYAVFHYKGKPDDAGEIFKYIYRIWFPNSQFDMDARPYFALMGERYRREDPESEEEFWIPIRKK